MFEEKPSLPMVEQALLGALLSNKKSISQVAHLLDRKDFFEPVHGLVFEAIKDAHNNQKTLHPEALALQVAAEINGDGKRYILSLVGAAGMAHAITDYAHAIADMARLRDFNHQCAQAASESRDGTRKSPGELISDHIRKCEMILRQETSAPFPTNRDVSAMIANDCLAPAKTYATGIPILDDAMGGGGLHAGKAYGFAARKKMGKTILAGTISWNLNLRGVKHLFICGEMGMKEIHSRNICRGLAMFPSRLIRGGEEIATKINNFSETTPSNIIWYDAPGLKFHDLQNRIASAVYNEGIIGFFLDYWQLVGGKEKNQSQADHQEAVAQWIADICRKMNIWAVVTAQINQEGNTRGGEGLRLAFDQVYQICKQEENSKDAWLEMMDTRYTAWMKTGSVANPLFRINDKGPYFEAA